LAGIALQFVALATPGLLKRIERTSKLGQSWPAMTTLLFVGVLQCVSLANPA
jgi:hypothetical protein